MYSIMYLNSIYWIVSMYLGGWGVGGEDEKTGKRGDAQVYYGGGGG